MPRTLRRLPLLASAALTLGLAGALVLLALLDALLLHPLPGVREPARLAAVAGDVLSYPTVGDLGAAAAAPGAGLAGVAGYAHRWLAVSGSGAPQRALAGVVTSDFFRVIGAQAGRGRLLVPADSRPDAPPVAVLSFAFWRSRFGGSDAALGATLQLNGSPFTVVGVAAAALRDLGREQPPAIWIPAEAWIRVLPTSFGDLALERRGWGWLRTFVRLEPGTSIAAAQSVLDAEARRQAAAYPHFIASDFRIRLVAAELAAGGFRSSSAATAAGGALLALVGLLLALATASAAHLFLIRGEARRTELATRAAFGAGRRQLLGTLIVEPLTAAIVASAAGMLAARAALSALADRQLPGGQRLGDLGLTLEPRIIACGALLAVTAALVAGLLPARRLLGAKVSHALATRALGDRRLARARRLLSALQIAISVLLVSATGLCTRALARAAAVETGFDGAQLGFAVLDPGLARLPPKDATAFHAAALEAVSALPGVERATLTSQLPLTSDSDVDSVAIDGYVATPDERPVAELAAVGPQALSTLGIRLLAGRELDATDRAGAPATCVVSRAFAERYLRGRDPLGAGIEIAGQHAIVVGVARDVHAHGLADWQAPVVYLPLAQLDGAAALAPVAVIYRARGSAAALLTPVKQALAAALPSTPADPVGTFADLYGAAVAPQRFGAALFGLFGLIGTSLALVGIYGLVAHAAAARTREFGLRAALGAGRSAIARLALGSALRPVIAGAGVGLLVSLPLAFASRGLAFGLEGFDPVALFGALLLFAVMAALAASAPAWRAAHLDPAAALRDE